MDSELIQMLVQVRESVVGAFSIFQDPRNISTFYYIGTAFTLVSFSYLASQFFLFSRLITLGCFVILTGFFAMGVDGNLQAYMTNISVELLGAIIAILMISSVFILDKMMFVVLWGALTFMMLLTIEYASFGGEFFMNAATEILGIFIITLILEREAFSIQADRNTYRTQLQDRLSRAYVQHIREDTQLHQQKRSAGEIRLEVIGATEEQVQAMTNKLYGMFDVIGETDDMYHTNDELIFRYVLAQLPENEDEIIPEPEIIGSDDEMILKSEIIQSDDNK